MAEFKVNQVVKNRRGNVGVVMGFNNKPSLVVFEGFVTPTKKFDENFKTKNHEYDIVEVYEGKKVENYTDVYRKSFDLSTLKKVYKEV